MRDALNRHRDQASRSKAIDLRVGLPASVPPVLPISLAFGRVLNLLSNLVTFTDQVSMLNRCRSFFGTAHGDRDQRWSRPRRAIYSAAADIDRDV